MPTCERPFTSPRVHLDRLIFPARPNLRRRGNLLPSLRSSIAGLSILAALTTATSVSAATVFDGETFRGVQILGSTYDVTFHDGVFDTVFPQPSFTFASLPDATVAVEAIRSTAAFQSYQPSTDFFGFLVPFGFRDAVSVWSVVGAASGVQGWSSWNRARDVGSRLTWVQFELSAVPEPATWAMMIIGFGAVGSMVRTSRRRNVFSAA